VEDHVRIRAELDAMGAEVAGLKDTFPSSDRLRGTPAEILHGGRGIGNSFVSDDLPIGGEHTLHFAAVDADGVWLLCYRETGGKGE
jgi:hypothetical protein